VPVVLNGYNGLEALSLQTDVETHSPCEETCCLHRGIVQREGSRQSAESPEDIMGVGASSSMVDSPLGLMVK
jgi:hypothetical protein